MIKIAFYPNTEKGLNQYTSYVQEAIKIACPDIKIFTFPGNREIVFKKINFDIAWLNWYENMPSSPRQFFKTLILKVLIILKLQLKHIKIYTVFHNKRPHDSKFPKLNIWFFKFLLKRADKIIVLSNKSQNIIKNLIGSSSLNKIVKISHPCYEIEKTKINNSKKKEKEFKVLFFGMIRRYKNIEMILNLAEELKEINFIIAGESIDKIYAESISKRGETLPNIELILKRLSDEELRELIFNSDIIILPYDINSSLNSGSLFYSLSKGRNVIIPHIPSVDEFVNKDAIFSYDYKSHAEHYYALRNALLKAYNEFIMDRNGYILKEEVLQKEVSQFTVDYLAKQILEANLLTI